MNTLQSIVMAELSARKSMKKQEQAAPEYKALQVRRQNNP